MRKKDDLTTSVRLSLYLTKEFCLLCQLQVTLPDFFDRAALITAPHRYVALYYIGTNAIWDSGTSMSSFSFYGLYRPLINHITVALWRAHADADFGSDDSEPTHALLLDRETRSLYLASFDEAMQFLRSEQQDFQAFDVPHVETNTRMGLFEMLGGVFGGGYSPQQQQETKELIAHLDNCVSNKMLPILDEFSKQQKGTWQMFQVGSAFKAFYERYKSNSGKLTPAQ